MKSIVKLIIKIIAILIMVVILFNYIPIKNSHKLNNNDKMTLTEETEDIIVVCRFEQVTGSPWMVEEIISQDKTILEKSEFIIIEGENPKKYLKNGLFIPGNSFVFKGQLDGEKHLDGLENYKVFVASSWDIIYPIDRYSIRLLFAPKGYLTIYDYEWPF
ncbi:hypothetical protein RBH29_13730 [Herbivorax sp. ANBcel31]|uniref:hypothetical protein n=1 Tax=Herbivorax sp. ANBcel31 TaxID=3069754 RepID=UPI0027B7A5A1|nr:hypothetical protein [Herbivorax sp. ANBcel31]MDQ2087487.1 hypothetical protein [Herbivorax sp. ANBcel31]